MKITPKTPRDTVCLGKHSVCIPADLDDPEDRAVSETGLERGLMGRRIRVLRNKLGLTQEQFANRYGIAIADIRQYEIGRAMPPLAVQAYLKAIEAEPFRIAKALKGKIRTNSI